jgi:hypothetical protein
MPGGGPEMRGVATLVWANGALTGWQRTQMGRIPISNASFKDGIVAFAVQRTTDGEEYSINYQGKLTGDTIEGTVEFPSSNDNPPKKVEWTASRSP